MVGRVLRIAVSALALFGALAARADYEAARRAWDTGRPAEALAQWQAAAGSGDRPAMLAPGRMYLRGLGVLQDYVEAHKWLNLAASRGEGSGGRGARCARREDDTGAGGGGPGAGAGVAARRGSGHGRNEGHDRRAPQRTVGG